MGNNNLCLDCNQLFSRIYYDRKESDVGSYFTDIGNGAFLSPILLPVKDDIETLKKRAQKERTKAWHKGKFNQSSEEE